jgi:hypothetical protein
MINKNVVTQLEPLFRLVEEAVTSDPPAAGELAQRALELLPEFGENLFTLMFCLV